MSDAPSSGEVVKSPTRREKLASMNGVGTNRSATNPFVAEVKDFGINGQTRRTIPTRNGEVADFSDHEHCELAVEARKESLHALKKKAVSTLRRYKATASMVKKWEDPEAGDSMFVEAMHSAAVIQEHYRAVVIGNRARAKYKIMLKYKNAVRDMCGYIIFLFFIVVTVIMRTAPHSVYMLQKNLKDVIVDEEFLPSDSHIRKSFTDIASEDELWQYLEGPLIRNMFPPSCYQSVGEELSSCIGKVHRSTYLTGGIRLRQIRGAKMDSKFCASRSPVSLIKYGKTPDCYEQYDIWYSSMTGSGKLTFWNSREDLGEYPRTPDIVVKNDSVSEVKALGIENCFKYSYNKKTVGSFFLGSDEYAQYPSSIGYTCELKVENGQKVPHIIAALKKNEWFDDTTRGLFVEMTMYNPSLGILTAAQLILEFPVTGGILSSYSFDSATLLQARTLLETLVCELSQLVVSYLCLAYLVVEYTEVKSLGFSAYFGQLWNYFDLVGYFSLLIGHTLIVYLRFIEWDLLERNVESAQDNSLVEYVVFANGLNWTFSFVLIVCTIKVFKYMQASPNLSILIETVKEAADTLGYFVIILVVLTFGFALAFFVTFSTHSYEFRTVSQAFWTLFSTLVGRVPNYADLYAGNRVMAPMLFFLYMFLVAVVAFSMFLTIISDEYLQVKERVTQKMEDDEIDMLMHRIRHSIGVVKHSIVNCLGGKSRFRRRFLMKCLRVVDKRTQKQARRLSSITAGPPSNHVSISAADHTTKHGNWRKTERLSGLFRKSKRSLNKYKRDLDVQCAEPSGDLR